MTDDRSLERAARSWLDEGPTRAPDRPVEAALARIQTIRQERDLRVPWRLPSMNGASRLLAGAASIAVVLVIGVIAISPGLVPGIGGPPTPTPAPTPSPAMSGVLPSPTSNLGACRLVTSTEAAEIAGDPGLGALPFQSGAGEATTCIYSDGGGNVVLRLEQTRVGGAAAFEAVRDRAGIELVPDLGDEAMYDPTTFTLYVLEGDALVAIVARSFLDDPADRRATALEIAEVLIARL